MIKRDIEPIGHIPPLRPIEINPRKVTIMEPRDAPEPSERLSQEECERFWKLLVQAAEGRGAPVEVDTDGWDAA